MAASSGCCPAAAAVSGDSLAFLPTGVSRSAAPRLLLARDFLAASAHASASALVGQTNLTRLGSGVNLYAWTVVHRQLAVHDAQLAAAEKLLGILRLLGRGVHDDIQPLIGRERPEVGVVDEGFVVSHFLRRARAVGESEALMARDEALKSTKKGLL